MLSLVFIPFKVSASETAGARIGNQFFDTLEEAIENASSIEVITLMNNVSLNNTLEIKKTVNIDLNGNNITASEKVFFIQGGSLKLIGNGKISETTPNYGAIMLKGSDDPNKEQFSTVTVDEGITLEGWSGIFINQHNKTAYGVLVTMNGTINSLNDSDGEEGVGIYVNGSIKHQNNAPIINLGKTAKITSTGNGIYAAGYATYNINGAHIEGKESGLGIKSGIFNINDGIIIGTGDDKTPTTGNNNGINASGTAIQIESNNGYAGDIELYIKNGTFISKKSNVIYEYTVNSSDTKVKNINIKGGKFVSDSGKNVFSLSTSFINNYPKFISGGQYSSNPNNYLISGYSSTNVDGLYSVNSGTMGVFGIGNSNNNMSFIITVVSIIILGIIAYLNRKKILRLFSNINNNIRK